MKPRIQHIVETRFSIVDARSSSRMTGDERFSRDWLEERLDLLRRFCLPSLAAQTSEDFVWALYCDEVTDGDVLDRLRGLAATMPNLRLTMTGRDRSQAEATADLIDPEADVLITTRLDSDDALCDDYLESVQAYAAPFHRSSHRDLLVNFPHGYRLDARDDGLYAEWMSFSPFHSLLERPKAHRPMTVMHGGHGRLHYEHPTQQDGSLSRWLIVVHGGNLINRIRDDMPRVEREGTGVPGFTLAADALSPRPEPDAAGG